MEKQAAQLTASRLNPRGGVKLLRLRTALHTLKLSQISFSESHTQRIIDRNTLREIYALRALPVYPVFEDEKIKGSKKSL